MRIMTKITVNMGNNLRNSYSKYESHPRMFATAKPGLVVAGWRRGKKTKKKSRKKKTSAKNIRHLVLRTGCLITLLASCLKGSLNKHVGKI